MGKVYETIDSRVREFIKKQKMFFVATAPRDDKGLVNLSPKGLDGTFAVIDEQTVAYLDLTGSGIETIAHLKDNGRICVLFCAFEGPPLLVRIHGRGEVLLPDNPKFEPMMAHFSTLPGIRSIIVVHATRISDSCGYGVPLYAYEGHRDHLPKWSERKGPQGAAEYRRKNNAKSLDGLPGLADE